MNKFVTACAAIALAATCAFAQTARPAQPRAGGGSGQMAPRRMGMGMGLLMRPEVQKELKLTAAQQKTLSTKLKALAPKPGGSRTEADMAALAKKRDAAVKGSLSATQYTRYKQIELQVQGPFAFTRPETATRLGLSKAQKTKLETIQRTAFDKMRKSAGANGNNRPDRGAIEKMRDSLSKQMLAVLTPAQTAKWKAMTGKPFKLQAGGPGRR